MKKLLIANWKANPDSPGRAVALARKIEGKISLNRNVEIVIAPPFPFLGAVGKVLRKAKLGAQDSSWEDTGPHTGEVSWHQLKHLKISYVIIGHSERRQHLKETDEMVNLKVRALLKNGLRPVLCVGERFRHGNEIPPLVGEQLMKALASVPTPQAKNLVVTYEPVWAISTNSRARADTPDSAFRAKIYLRKILADLYGRRTAEVVPILYGGSVNAANIVPFLTEGRMDGALVGSASLQPDQFASIVRQTSQCD